MINRENLLKIGFVESVYNIYIYELGLSGHQARVYLYLHFENKSSDKVTNSGLCFDEYYDSDLGMDVGEHYKDIEFKSMIHISMLIRMLSL